jgi:hypothetical protein
LDVRGTTLTAKDIGQLPCEDLRILDQLWIKFSDGHFGFSIQQRIYVETGNSLDGEYHQTSYRKFGDVVGWREEGEWMNSFDIKFALDASPGALPKVWDGNGRGRSLWKGWVAFFSLAESCELWHSVASAPSYYPPHDNTP